MFTPLKVLLCSAILWITFAQANTGLRHLLSKSASNSEVDITSNIQSTIKSIAELGSALNEEVLSKPEAKSKFNTIVQSIAETIAAVIGDSKFNGGSIIPSNIQSVTNSIFTSATDVEADSEFIDDISTVFPDLTEAKSALEEIGHLENVNDIQSENKSIENGTKEIIIVDEKSMFLKDNKNEEVVEMKIESIENIEAEFKNENEDGEDDGSGSNDVIEDDGEIEVDGSAVEGNGDIKFDGEIEVDESAVEGNDEIEVDGEIEIEIDESAVEDNNEIEDDDEIEVDEIVVQVNDENEEDDEIEVDEIFVQGNDEIEVDKSAVEEDGEKEGDDENEVDESAIEGNDEIDVDGEIEVDESAVEGNDEIEVDKSTVEEDGENEEIEDDGGIEIDESAVEEDGEFEDGGEIEVDGSVAEDDGEFEVNDEIKDYGEIEVDESDAEDNDENKGEEENEDDGEMEVAESTVEHGGEFEEDIKSEGDVINKDAGERKRDKSAAEDNGEIKVDESDVEDNGRDKGDGKIEVDESVVEDDGEIEVSEGAVEHGGEFEEDIKSGGDGKNEEDGESDKSVKSAVENNDENEDDESAEDQFKKFDNILSLVLVRKNETEIKGMNKETGNMEDNGLDEDIISDSEISIESFDDGKKVKSGDKSNDDDLSTNMQSLLEDMQSHLEEIAFEKDEKMDERKRKNDSRNGRRNFNKNRRMNDNNRNQNGKNDENRNESKIEIKNKIKNEKFENLEEKDEKKVKKNREENLTERKNENKIKSNDANKNKNGKRIKNKIKKNVRKAENQIKNVKKIKKEKKKIVNNIFSKFQHQMNANKNRNKSKTKNINNRSRVRFIPKNKSRNPSNKKIKTQHASLESKSRVLLKDGKIKPKEKVTVEEFIQTMEKKGMFNSDSKNSKEIASESISSLPKLVHSKNVIHQTSKNTKVLVDTMIDAALDAHEKTIQKMKDSELNINEVVKDLSIFKPVKSLKTNDDDSDDEDNKGMANVMKDIVHKLQSYGNDNEIEQMMTQSIMKAKQKKQRIIDGNDARQKYANMKKEQSDFLSNGFSNGMNVNNRRLNTGSHASAPMMSDLDLLEKKLDGIVGPIAIDAEKEDELSNFASKAIAFGEFPPIPESSWKSNPYRNNKYGIPPPFSFDHKVPVLPAQSQMQYAQYGSQISPAMNNNGMQQPMNGGFNGQSRFMNNNGMQQPMNGGFNGQMQYVNNNGLQMSQNPGYRNMFQVQGSAMPQLQNMPQMVFENNNVVASLHAQLEKAHDEDINIMSVPKNKIVDAIMANDLRWEKMIKKTPVPPSKMNSFSSNYGFSSSSY